MSNIIIVPPVVIPVRHEVECIIQDGKRYCEKELPTKVEGVALLIVILWILLIAYLVNQHFEKRWWGGWIIIVVFGLPILMAIGQIICGN